MRKAKKTKKAEIATFLTLGLVLVGAVLSLLSGVMVNRQKNIASNPRAGYDTGMPGSLLSPPQRTPTKTPPSTPTPIRTSTPIPTKTPTPTTSTNYNCPKPIPSPDKACCFCQNGKVRVYASSNARKNNCMATPCTSEHYKNAYGAESWGYCNDDGKNYEKNCKPVITEGEKTIPSPTPPTQAAAASQALTPPYEGCINKGNARLCGEYCGVSESEKGYTCKSKQGENVAKWCCPPSPTPPTPGAEGGTGAPVSPSNTPIPSLTQNLSLSSNFCENIKCENYNVYYSRKCLNPYYINNTTSCGGRWEYYEGQNCQGTIITYPASNIEIVYCVNAKHNVQLTIKFNVRNLNYDPNDPSLHFVVQDYNKVVYNTQVYLQSLNDLSINLNNVSSNLSYIMYYYIDKNKNKTRSFYGRLYEGINNIEIN